MCSWASSQLFKRVHIAPTVRCYSQQERAQKCEREMCSRASSHQTALVAALGHGDVRMGRNLSDRHTRSDPAANRQKDKKGKQFPHNRLRSGWVG